MAKISDLIAQRVVCGDSATRARQRINNMIRAHILRPEAAPGERIAREFSLVEAVLTHVAFDLERPKLTDAAVREVLDALRRQFLYAEAYERGDPDALAQSRTTITASSEYQPDEKIKAWQAIRASFDNGFAWLTIAGNSNIDGTLRYRALISFSNRGQWMDELLASDFILCVRLQSLRVLGRDVAVDVDREKASLAVDVTDAPQSV